MKLDKKRSNLPFHQVNQESISVLQEMTGLKHHQQQVQQQKL